MKKMICLVLLTCILLSCLSGCTYATLHSKQEVIDQIEARFPGAQFVSVEEKFLDGYDLIGEENKKAKFYTFENGDFEFHVYEVVTNDIVIGNGLTVDATTDYYEKLYEFKKDELDQIFQDSDVPIYYGEDTYTKDLNNGKDRDEFHDENPFMCYFEYPMLISSITNFSIYFYITDGEQINQCIDLLEQLCDVVKDYLPEEENAILDEYLSIVFWTSKEYLPEGADFENYWSFFYSYEKDSFVKHDFDFEQIRDAVNDKYNSILKKES